MGDAPDGLGYNVAAVYSPQAQASGRYFDDPVTDLRFVPWWRERTDEVQWDATLSHLGWEGLRADPARVVAVAANNTASTAGLHNLDGPERLDGRILGLVHISEPPYGAVTLLGLGALLAWRRTPVVRALLAVVGPLVVLSLVTIYAPRLRAPLDLAFAIGVGLLFSTLSARGAAATAATGERAAPGEDDIVSSRPSSARCATV